MIVEKEHDSFETENVSRYMSSIIIPVISSGIKDE